MRLRRLLAWVDSESFRVTQSIIYFWYFVAGVYMTFCASVPAVLFDATGPWYNDAWAISFIVCPLLVWLGSKLPNQYSGNLIQSGANFCVLILLGVYGASLIHADLLARGTFALFLIGALMSMSALISFRDLRKFLLIRAVAQEIDAEKEKRRGMG